MTQVCVKHESWMSFKAKTVFKDNVLIVYNSSSIF